MILRRLALAFVFVALVAAGAGVAWFRQRAFVEHALPRTATTVVVPEGATGREVARRLARAGIIDSPLAFEALAALRGERSKMQAGEFRFAPHRTEREVLRQLVSGGEAVARWVTIPEGFTARQIARTLADARLGDERTLDDTFLHGSLVLGGTRTPSLEGYLFPDTYLVPLGASPARIATMFTGQFRSELPPGAARRARALGYTLPQIVTVASLVEREAKADGERPLMAGVYYNRLRRGMPLQVDATIEYAFAHHKDTITSADLRLNSPYNTYRHAGLPPTPIANPGLSSLLAALHPQPSDFLYYVYMGNGHHAFSRTLAEQNANVARYLR